MSNNPIYSGGSKRDLSLSIDLNTQYDLSNGAEKLFDNILSNEVDTSIQMPSLNKSKFLRIFDRKHNILDEIETYDNLSYGWTLNDIDSLTFNIGLEDNKCNESNMQMFNHIEIWDNDQCYWGGVIAGRSFEGSKLKVNCLDYMFLLKFRRLRAKTYPTRDYGTLMTLLINDVNAILSSGVTIGNISNGSLQTTRIVQNTDYCLDKIKEFNYDANYDFDVDVDRKFNFHIRKGADKPYYQLEYGGDADNILEAPSLAQDVMSMANSVYSEIQNNGSISLSSLAQDNYSQNLYGLVEGTFSANNGVTDQATINNQTNGALQRSAYPPNSFSIKAKDSSLCPFSDIQVGDRVTVSLIPYFGFKSLMRIIKMVHDENTGVRDITFGEIIYRPQPPVKKLYKKG